MTASIKEALEQASAMLVCLSRRYTISENHKIRFTGKWSHMGEISLGEVLDNANTALASLESGDARETIAKMICEDRGVAKGQLVIVNAANARAEQAGRALASVHAGLELLLAAVNADDPKREILVRIGDLMRDAQPARAFVAQPIVKAAKVAEDDAGGG
jgi:hypothetical protein